VRCATGKQPRWGERADESSEFLTDGARPPAAGARPRRPSAAGGKWDASERAIALSRKNGGLALTLKSQTLDGDILVVFQGAEKSHLLLVSGARWADKQLQYPAHDTGTGTSSSKGHHWHTWVTSWCEKRSQYGNRDSCARWKNY
jgi:hypothetical protein